MAGDQKSPLLLVTARKKRFLDLVQGLCDEFDSLHKFVEPGSEQDASSDGSLQQRQWSLPLSSILDRSAMLPPAERPWGVANGFPPATRLPQGPQRMPAAQSPRGVLVESIPAAAQRRPMKEPESELPPSAQRSTSNLSAVEKSQGDVTALSVPTNSASKRQIEEVNTGAGCSSDRAMQRQRTPSLTSSTGGLNSDVLAARLSIIAQRGDPCNMNELAFLDQGEGVAADPQGMVCFRSEDSVVLPTMSSGLQLQLPLEPVPGPHGDGELKSPQSGYSPRSPGGARISTSPSGLLQRAGSMVGAAVVSAVSSNSGSPDARMSEEHWTRNHIKTIYARKGFMTSSHNENGLTKFVNTPLFKGSAAALIMLNSVFVGFEMDQSIRRAFEGRTELEDGVMEALNAGFTALFTIELIARVAAFRIHFFLGDEWQWNTFDALIVASALAEYALSGLNGFSALRALRALRLAKTLRIIRVVTVFRNLQLIVHGLMNSLMSLVWMIFLMLLMIYLVSIVFVGAASNYLVDQTVAQAIIGDETAALPGDEMTYGQMRTVFARHFANLPRGMYTMFLSVTGGLDWYEVLQPLLCLSWIYAFIFAGFVIFVVFGVFNVLNAVFVEAVLTNRDKDLLIQSEQAKTKVFMRDLANLFKEGDLDGNQSFSKDELQDHCRNPRFCAYLSTHALDASDAQVLFEMLDADGNGRIDIEEFVLGAMKLKGTARCLDMLKAQSSYQQISGKVDKILKSLDFMAKQQLINGVAGAQKSGTISSITSSTG